MYKALALRESGDCLKTLIIGDFMQTYAKITVIALRILVSLLVFFLIAGLLSVGCEKLASDSTLEQQRTIYTPYVATPVIIMLFYSVVRSGVLFDFELREKYIEKHDSINTLASKLKLFFGMKYTVVATILFLLLLWLLPTKLWCPLHLVFLVEGEGNTAFSLISFGVALVLTFLLGIKAVTSAMNFWMENLLYSKKARFKYTLSGYILKHLELLLAYIVGGSLALAFTCTAGVDIINFVINNFSTLFGLFTLCFHVLFIFPKVTKRIVSVCKRKKFLRELEAVCSEHHCSLSTIEKPYKSLFKNYEDEYNFDFERGGKVYACKLMSTKHRLRPMTFFDDGAAAISKIIKVKKVELFRINKYVKYSYEAEGKEKLIVINPIPKTLFISDRGGEKLIDNGDRVWDYKVYSASALINAIDRNCLDR